MNKKLKRLETWYFRISFVFAVIFTGYNYSNTTEIIQIGKLFAITVTTTVFGFVALNLLDLLLGIIKSIIDGIRRKRHDKRLLDAFCTNTNEEEEN